MKAVRIHGWNQPPAIEQVAEPVRTAGRSIVRMAAATVGHIDRTVWSGRFLNAPSLPYIPGVEASGIVLESDRFAAGQRVWLRGGGLGTLADGTWRELIDAPDDALGALPDAVPMALGSAFFSPCTSAWVALHEVARLRAGEHVLVTGATGAVGSLAVQLALDLGARVSVAVRRNAGGLPAGVRRIDIDGDVDSEGRSGGNDEGGDARRAALFAGVQADALIDTVGGDPLKAALSALVPGGRAVLVGYTAGNELTLDLAQFLQRDVALLPLNMFRREAAGRAAAPELLARLGDGRLRLEVREFALSDAGAALEWITQRGHRGRAVLVPERTSD